MTKITPLPLQIEMKQKINPVNGICYAIVRKWLKAWRGRNIMEITVYDSLCEWLKHHISTPVEIHDVSKIAISMTHMYIWMEYLWEGFSNRLQSLWSQPNKNGFFQFAASENWANLFPLIACSTSFSLLREVFLFIDYAFHGGIRGRHEYYVSCYINCHSMTIKPVHIHRLYPQPRNSWLRYSFILFLSGDN